MMRLDYVFVDTTIDVIRRIYASVQNEKEKIH